MPAIEFTQGPLAGRRLTLEHQTYTLGRHPDSDLPLDERWPLAAMPSCARRRTAGNIVDLGSTNGTMLNNVNITAAGLAPGDIIQIGSECHRLPWP